MFIVLTQHLPDQLSFSMHPILLSLRFLYQVYFVLPTHSCVYGLLLGLGGLTSGDSLKENWLFCSQKLSSANNSSARGGTSGLHPPDVDRIWFLLLNKNAPLSGQFHSQWLSDTSINFKSVLPKRVRTSMCCLLPILKYYWNNHRSMFESPVSCMSKYRGTFQHIQSPLTPCLYSI